MFAIYAIFVLIFYDFSFYIFRVELGIVWCTSHPDHSLLLPIEPISQWLLPGSLTDLRLGESWLAFDCVSPARLDGPNQTPYGTRRGGGRWGKASSQAPSGLERHGGSIPPVLNSFRPHLSVGPISWWSSWIMNRHRSDVDALKA